MTRRDTVLVVDDDAHFRELYRAALQFRGSNVAAAADGLTALQSIPDEPVRPERVIPLIERHLRRIG